MTHDKAQDMPSAPPAPPETREGSNAPSTASTRSGRTPPAEAHADAADDLLAAFGLNGRPHLQKALRGLDLSDPSVHRAATHYLANQAGQPSPPLLGTLEEHEAIQTAARYVRTRIERRAHLQVLEDLQDKLEIFDRKMNALDEHLQAQAQAVMPEDLDSIPWFVDPFELSVHYAPYTDLFDLAAEMGDMGEGELAIMAEDALFPESVKVRMELIKKATDLDVMPLMRDWARFLAAQPDAASRHQKISQVRNPDKAEALLQRLEHEEAGNEELRPLVFLAHRRLLLAGRISPEA